MTQKCKHEIEEDLFLLYYTELARLTPQELAEYENNDTNIAKFKRIIDNIALN